MIRNLIMYLLGEVSLGTHVPIWIGGAVSFETIASLPGAMLERVMLECSVSLVRICADVAWGCPSADTVASPFSKPSLCQQRERC